jgi:hypothetical protein
MPIQVTCPGCHKRFQVSDKFAGQQGPCPSCKTLINIPKKEDEAVIHAPEQFGAKGQGGRAIFQPIARTETKFSPAVAGIVALITLLVFALAWLNRPEDGSEGPSKLLLAIGAVVLGPPLAYAGYTFLRDDELEPYRGISLWIRVAIVGVVYAVIWGVVGYWIKGYFLEMEPGQQFETFQLAIVIPAMIAVGAFASFAALDLEVSTAAIHFGLYLLVTVLLRLTMGMTIL